MSDLKTLLVRFDQLEGVIDSGAMSIQFDGEKRITYRSQNEMREALATMGRRIASLEGKTITRAVGVIPKSAW